MTPCPEKIDCQTGEPDDKTCPPLIPKGEPPCCGKVEVPDGVYTTITIKNGCPIGYGLHEVPAYTPPLCCDSETTIITDPGGDVNISGAACNLLQDDNGLLVTPVYATGVDAGNVQVTGCGTDTNPYVLNYTGSTDGSPVSWGNTTADVLNISGDGTPTSPLIFAHAEKQTGPVDSSLQIDAYGHVISFSPSSNLGFTPAPPLVMNTVGGSQVLSINSTVSGTYTSPWGSITVSGGLVTNIVNTPGTVTPGTFTTVDGKTVTYNNYGLIVSVA